MVSSPRTAMRFFTLISCAVQQPVSYTHLDVYKRQGLDEVTPWSHLDYGVSREYLVREYQKALGAQKMCIRDRRRTAIPSCFTR